MYVDVSYSYFLNIRIYMFVLITEVCILHNANLLVKLVLHYSRLSLSLSLVVLCLSFFLFNYPCWFSAILYSLYVDKFVF